ncbi:MAG TPA: chemotaxis protein [Cyanobacteria bacterium UBA11149]|nr:chemotaxis protein [Cyanobacteria bacterium UBA11367]HBE60730.1 chemotaxis protein [Cyanobacteria bacterium UBA11366]HBK65461.1 chemotaxis protein [Cyanobacteria bacterium UBA11166]HBR74473.1 chemotaxis protein [Cyanobacteria bacterium UBA11159]HBS68271.1 chemotaxis protein [Cyanobacteria bacterium UBA11153]HBW91388.1 chemotaxis protein [Cyanobacteria bacterium UBA11149]HCA93577.1 chemotaxis protein [Cyanobacteria bacterium UBA9226]
MNSLDSVLTASTLDPLSLEPLPPDRRTRLLRFPLGLEDSALLPLGEIAEILRVNVAEILPVPKMPGCVLGICNWRGEMLWLIDINHLVGGYPLLQQEQILTSVVAMVIQANEQSLGLVVPQVNDIELYDLEQIQTAASGLFPSRLLPFILGAIPGDKGTVLNVRAIIQSPLWQVHRS